MKYSHSGTSTSKVAPISNLYIIMAALHVAAITSKSCTTNRDIFVYNVARILRLSKMILLL